MERNFLLGVNLSFVDLALCSFIRQFVNVYKSWLANEAIHKYPKLMGWLSSLLDSVIFKETMKNRPVWNEDHQPLWLDESLLKSKNQFREKDLA